MKTPQFGATLSLPDGQVVSLGNAQLYLEHLQIPWGGSLSTLGVQSTSDHCSDHSWLLIQDILVVPNMQSLREYQDLGQLTVWKNSTSVQSMLFTAPVLALATRYTDQSRSPFLSMKIPNYIPLRLTHSPGPGDSKPFSGHILVELRGYISPGNEILKWE